MIEVTGLTQGFGKKIVLADIDLRIEKSEICALVGRNGAGKSTFINSLLGLLPVKQGTVKINDITRTGKKRTFQNEIAFLPEKFMLYPALTGMENMLFFAGTASGKPDVAEIEISLKAVNLWDDRDTKVKQYSKGMLQRLGLAITLYQDADILILDEPTSGIDPMGRQEILEVLKSLSGKTILLSSHHLDEIRQVCTHVAFLENSIIKKYTVTEFMKAQRLGDYDNEKVV
ncbi:ABC transporter ATP-binding protein [Bacillus canaveralius]|uniref:ABC transporter ATP-binding protein n=1 Tax=Bacillus canaveralius TaxID=1403243 RepID=A0A2N5GJW1_9BACI|nr:MULTISPECIES: ABC transporter ATP-binding protein [Bacillus]PLR81601.1 ABC transporter ATP-binding protein [Bacillus canaveralius]PLR85548.1 ABC transporter ATP-binding protein [Bacillus sp. V33-4]PLR90858.1 ABC transporter ATP-binding protein [Bacillus canaveralius]RSK57572.1 ABC transporter ATP-binding protein [Bacillus canaveralius]